MSRSDILCRNLLATAAFLGIATLLAGSARASVNITLNTKAWLNGISSIANVNLGPLGVLVTDQSAPAPVAGVIANYRPPTAGQAVWAGETQWNAVTNLLARRAEEATAARYAREIVGKSIAGAACFTNLNLQSGPCRADWPAVWYFDTAAGLCPASGFLLSDLTFYSTGTIINSTGCNLKLSGEIKSHDGTQTLAIIDLAKSGALTIDDSAILTNVAVFSRRRVIIAPRTGAVTHRASIVAQEIQFPASGQVTFDSSPALLLSPPPLLSAPLGVAVRDVW